MKRVLWHRRAEEELLSIPSIDDATAVDAAVQYFARTGVGFVRRVDNDDARPELRLYVPNASHYLVIHVDDDAVYVWRVARRAPLRSMP